MANQIRVFGLDFTSVPSRNKPITRAHAILEGARLTIDRLDRLVSFEAFEDALAEPGPWTAGIDFPFGQPVRFLEQLPWPFEWPGYVANLRALDRAAFRSLLEEFKRPRPAGDREYLRAVDRLAGGQSPMKLYGVPVALMFFEGAQRLLRTSINIPPLRRTGDSRTVLEAYPAIVVRYLLGKARYKAEERDHRLRARDHRASLVRLMVTGGLKERYGLELTLAQDVVQASIEDGSGDSVDAVLCAVQAAWAAARPERDLGVPQDADPAEGWIVDPGLLLKSVEGRRRRAARPHLSKPGGTLLSMDANTPTPLLDTRTSLPVRQMTVRFNEALAGAANLHAQQKRKGTDIPYVAHLLGVAGIALDYGADEDEAIAALLHDTIEDAPTELGADWVRRWLGFTFGSRVLATVEACTDADVTPKPPWRDRKEAYIRQIPHKDASAVLVSAADKLHNARAILADFQVPDSGVFSRFSAEPVGVVSYYRGLADAFAKRCQTLESGRRARIGHLVEELQRTVTALESASGITGRWPMQDPPS